MMRTILLCCASAVFAAFSSSAAETDLLCPAEIDFGELVVGESCTRKFVISNVTSSALLFERIEADNGVGVQLFEGAVGPRAAVSGCVSVKPAAAGELNSRLLFVCGGDSNSFARISLTGHVAECDPDVAYPESGLKSLREPLPKEPGRFVVWRSQGYVRDVLRAFQVTNLGARAVAFFGLARRSSSRLDATLAAVRGTELQRTLRWLFVDGKGTDKDRDRIFCDWGGTWYLPSGDKSIDDGINAHWRKRDEARRAKADAEMRRKIEIQNQERKAKLAAEERKREEERRQWMEKEAARKRENTWLAAGLPGERPAGIWADYLKGEGCAFADNVHFKTNVFLPFLIKEFCVDREKDATLQRQMREFLEKEFADLLCHTGNAWETVRSYGKNMNLGEYGKAADWAYDLWKGKKCKSPLVLALAVHSWKFKCWKLPGKTGRFAWAMAYEFSEPDVPKGRDGLAVHFVRDVNKCVNRLHVDKDYPDNHAKSITDWCRALEKEGARLEQWRCVLLLTLRVIGNCQVPPPYIRCIEALEKAGCAPDLVRMFREEPVFRYNCRSYTGVAGR